MKRRTGDIQVFSVSFLDLLSCGLGAVLLLLLIVMQQSQAAREEAENDNAKSKAIIDKMQQELVQSKSAQAAMVGWKGPLQNMVFVFDTSGSMAAGDAAEKFPHYKGLLARWVEHYPFARFAVIQFDSVVRPERPVLMDATDANRAAAARKIQQFTAQGSTATREALAAALQVSGVDTIVLMSDGMPNDKPDSVVSWLRGNNPRRVIINSVAMGDHKGPHRVFLETIATESGGTFDFK